MSSWHIALLLATAATAACGGTPTAPDRRALLGLSKTDAERRALGEESPAGRDTVQSQRRHRREPSFEGVPDPDAKSAT